MTNEKETRTTKPREERQKKPKIFSKTKTKDGVDGITFGKRIIEATPSKKGEIPRTGCQKDTLIYNKPHAALNTPFEDLKEMWEQK